MNFEPERVIVTNYNRPPCWKKRVTVALIVAFGATITLFQLLAAFRFIL